MTKKLLFICMLAVLQDAILATGSHSFLGKRSHDEMDSSAVTFQSSKRQALECQLVPVEDSRSRSSDVDQEPYFLFKNDMSTSSNSIDMLEENSLQTQSCEHSAMELNDFSNEQLMAFAHVAPISSSSEEIYADASLSSVQSSSEEELFGEKSANYHYEPELSINNNPIIFVTDFGGIYCSDAKERIYLQNSRELNEDKFTFSVDGFCIYEDQYNEIVRVWDKFGFECDPATNQRLPNPLAFSTQFSVVSRRPEHAKKEYFECPEQDCRELDRNKDYDALRDHLRRRHKSKKPFICHYQGCNFLSNNFRQLAERHETSHRGIEFICQICSESFANEQILKYQHLKNKHGSNVHNTNVAPILPRDQGADSLPSASEDWSQASSIPALFEDDFLNEHQVFGDDLFFLAQEVFEEEANNEQSMGSVDASHEHQLVRKAYFCPDCLVNFNTKGIKHIATCRNQGLNKQDMWTIDDPVVIKHGSSADLYCLHPTLGAIYLQDSNGLHEGQVVINQDGSFSYEDIDNGIIRFWDKLGFDHASRKRLAKSLKTEFTIISRRPEDAKKEYLECHMQGCSALVGNKDYETLENHVNAQHSGEKSYICEYKNCKYEHEQKSQLSIRHEIKHLGIEFICPSCFESFTRQDNLKNRHIKLQHPELYAEKYKK